MRKILFRGKRTDNGEWVYGYYMYSSFYNSHYICISDYAQYSKNPPFKNYIFTTAFKVIPETIGQYTGVDVDGVKIFEGDIVLLRKGVDYESNDTNLFKPLVVDYCLDFAGFDVFRPIDISSADKEHWVYVGVPACVGDIDKIIGNIHDNPELLEVE